MTLRRIKQKTAKWHFKLSMICRVIRRIQDDNKIVNTNFNN